MKIDEPTEVPLPDFSDTVGHGTGEFAHRCRADPIGRATYESYRIEYFQ